MGKRIRYDLLPVIAPGRRPTVLLVGNGIVQAFDKNARMDTLIQNTWKKNHHTSLPASSDKEHPHPLWALPFPLQIVVASKDRVQDCMSELAGNFKAADTIPEQEDMIQNILDAGFETILSTNYSLEFEKSVFPAFSEGKVKSNYRVTAEQTSYQERLGIYQCTELPYGRHPTLWHIHGTALREKSMVMGHHAYGKLLTEVTQRAERVFRAYKSTLTNNTTYRPFSWIDYFLIGDVYIVGFGLNPSEMDIWWLLNYKKLFEGTHVFYFDPHVSEEKKLLLDCYGIKAPAIPIYQKNRQDNYVDYYKRIFEMIGNNTDFKQVCLKAKN